MSTMLLLVLTTLSSKKVHELTVCVCVCVCLHISHVPGMQVMVDEQSSTILTAGHPVAVGGMVTMDTWRIGTFILSL